MKVCTHCKVNKSDSDFRKRREYRRRGGGPLVYMNNTCRNCDSELANKYYFAHKDEPGFLDKWTKKSRDYYQKHRDEIKEKMKVKRQTPEYKAMMKAYREKHKEKISSDSRKRNRVYVKKNTDAISPIYVERLKRTEKYQKDKAVARGGFRNSRYGNLPTEYIQTHIAVHRLKKVIKKLESHEEQSGGPEEPSV